MFWSMGGKIRGERGGGKEGSGKYLCESTH